MSQCTRCGAAVEGSACSACGAPVDLRATASEGAALAQAAGIGWESARLVLGLVTLGTAFAGTWHVVEGRDGFGPTTPAVIGLIAAMVGLVVDLVLQRAVIGQDFDPLLRLGARGVLVAPIVIYAAYDLAHGEWAAGASTNSTGWTRDGFAHLWPIVGSGPVLALAGAAIVVVGPWKDRFALPLATWRKIAALVAGLATVANCYQVIRALSTAADQAIGVRAAIGLSVTWLGMTLASAVLTWALVTGRRGTWPTVSLFVPAWVLAFFWQTTFNTSYPDAGDLGVEGSALVSALSFYFQSFGTIGAGLLVLALVLAAAPVMSLSSAERAPSRWIAAVRGLVLAAAAAFVVLAVMAGSFIGGTLWTSSGTLIGAGGGPATGPLVWILSMAVVLAIGGVVAWRALRNPARGRLIGIGWGLVAFVVVAITLLASESLRIMVGSDFFEFGRSSGLLAATTIVVPLATTAALLVPASLRQEYGSLVTSSVRRSASAPAPAPPTTPGRTGRSSWKHHHEGEEHMTETPNDDSGRHPDGWAAWETEDGEIVNPPKRKLDSDPVEEQSGDDESSATP